MPNITKPDSDTFIGDPDFEPCRDMIKGLLKTLQAEVDIVFTWMNEGVDAGGQLALITGLIAVTDFDANVRPDHIVSDLCNAYYHAEKQSTGLGEEMRRTRALARVPKPSFLTVDATPGAPTPWGPEES